MPLGRLSLFLDLFLFPSQTWLLHIALLSMRDILKLVQRQFKRPIRKLRTVTTMGGPSKPKSAPKKEKIFHPDSRKAAQLARTHLRKSKLAEATVKRFQKHAAQGQSLTPSIDRPSLALLSTIDASSLGAHASIVDVYGFFYHALPPVGVLALEELHAVVRDAWLTRHDGEVEQERAARRKGRPKSMKEMKLEEIKLRETEEYRTGIGEPEASPSPAYLPDVYHRGPRSHTRTYC